MEFEFIAEKVVPQSKKRAGKHYEVIEMWVNSENKTLKFKCKNEREVESVTGSANQYRRSHNVDYTVFKRKSLCEVYLVKA